MPSVKLKIDVSGSIGEDAWRNLRHFDLQKVRLLVFGVEVARHASIQLLRHTLIGFVDGQTTNPSLIAKNPEISPAHCIRPQIEHQKRKATNKGRLCNAFDHSWKTLVSIEVFSDLG